MPGPLPQSCRVGAFRMAMIFFISNGRPLDRRGFAPRSSPYRCYFQRSLRRMIAIFTTAGTLVGEVFDEERSPKVFYRLPNRNDRRPCSSFCQARVDSRASAENRCSRNFERCRPCLALDSAERGCEWILVARPPLDRSRRARRKVPLVVVKAMTCRPLLCFSGLQICQVIHQPVQHAQPIADRLVVR